MVKKNETKSNTSTNKSEILIKEKESVTISNWYVRADSIWISEGIIRVDLVMWAEDHMKPFSGGYKVGDEVEIGMTDDKRYVKEIKKFGRNNESDGYVVLVETKPANITTPICTDEMSIEETTKARVGEVEFGIGNILKKDGKTSAMLYPPNNSSFGGDSEVFENDTLWVGTCAYNVDRIGEGQENENGFIKLKKLNQKLE